MVWCSKSSTGLEWWNCFDVMESPRIYCYRPLTLGNNLLCCINLQTVVKSNYLRMLYLCPLTFWHGGFVSSKPATVLQNHWKKLIYLHMLPSERYLSFCIFMKTRSLQVLFNMSILLLFFFSVLIPSLDTHPPCFLSFCLSLSLPAGVLFRWTDSGEVYLDNICSTVWALSSERDRRDGGS